MNLARAYNFERLNGRIKINNADFKVIECLPETPSGEGEHLWLRVEKDGQNTAWVAEQLSQWAQVAERDVSYAGLKDRHAVTQQTFSIHLPGLDTPDLATLNIEGVRVIEANRHSKKLKTGRLIGNRFVIRIRACDQEISTIEANWKQICEGGTPNYFGEQRFGHQGQNVSRARQWLLGSKRVSRAKQSLYLSSARSYLFNKLTMDRVQAGTWNTLIDGDFVQFTEGKTGFYCDVVSEHDLNRCQAGQLSACASLPGDSKEVFEGLDLREAEILSDDLTLIDALKKRRVMRQFRKLRVFPEKATFNEVEGDPELSFFLPAGSYATSVLNELVDFSSTAEPN